MFHYDGDSQVKSLLPKWNLCAQQIVSLHQNIDLLCFASRSISAQAAILKKLHCGPDIRSTYFSVWCRICGLRNRFHPGWMADFNFCDTSIVIIRDPRIIMIQLLVYQRTPVITIVPACLSLDFFLGKVIKIFSTTSLETRDKVQSLIYFGWIPSCKLVMFFMKYCWPLVTFCLHAVSVCITLFVHDMLWWSYIVSRYLTVATIILITLAADECHDSNYH